nr:tRNA (guanosine(46)-N7)-methyltransferase TrmB [Buchnera aphidicola]
MKDCFNFQLFHTNYKTKSYVLRYRKTNFLNSSNIIQKLWAQFGITYTNNYISLQDIFENNKPIIVDIGFGSREYFVKKAEYYPNINFLGIEVYFPGILSNIKYANLYNINNIKIINYDAIDVFLYMIPNKILTMVQIFFPDPWPKRKHHKRRIITDVFIKLLSKKLMTNGIIYIKTDCLSYAYHIKKFFKI